MTRGLFGLTGFAGMLSCRIGETVTIFTASGGQSGSGFTGVVLSVDNCVVRLITKIGPPPACALGNACVGHGPGYGYGPGCDTGHMPGHMPGHGAGYPIHTIGSVTEIPISAIVSIVYNAV